MDEDLKEIEGPKRLLLVTNQRWNYGFIQQVYLFRTETPIFWGLALTPKRGATFPIDGHAMDDGPSIEKSLVGIAIESFMSKVWVLLKDP